MELVPINDYITGIDHNLMGMRGAGLSYVVRGPAGVAIVETGTSLTVPHTLAGLDALEIKPEAVQHILCTHVHMDHAGGAGYLADTLPFATVYIHSMTMPHLMEPDKLMGSVRRAVGEKSWPLHGDVKPLPEGRLKPAETLHIDLGDGIILEPIFTPGHSPDHVSFWERRSGGMFVGDALSLSMPRFDLHPPVAPPPAYNLDQHLATVDMLRNEKINVLYVTHAAAREDVAAFLDMTEQQLHRLAALAQEAIATSDEDTYAIADRWISYAGDDPDQQFMTTHLTEMSVRGMMRYFRKKQEQEQAAG